jgi:hypothetical protein
MKLVFNICVWFIFNNNALVYFLRKCFAIQLFFQNMQWLNDQMTFSMVTGFSLRLCMGNSPSKHRIFGKKFTQYKKLENLGKFGLFLVYRMYLNEKKLKMARKIRWSWFGECSMWHMFFGPKSVIFKHIHFSFGTTHQKNVKFCTIGAYVCVFKKKL